MTANKNNFLYLFYRTKMENNTAEKFYQYYKSFLQDIMISFPEFKDEIIEKHASLLRVNYPQSEKKRGKCDRRRKTVFKFIVDNGTMISEKDPKLFLLPECKTCLGKDIDFEKIWNSSISQTSREQLWNYLQTFYMLSVSESTNNDLSTLFKNFETVVENGESTDMMDNLKNITENMMKSIDSENENLTPEASAEAHGHADKLKEEFDGIFGNSMIGDLANDIAKDINIDELVKGNLNPTDLIGSLFGGGDGDGPNIMSIVENIGKSINKRVESGEIDEMQLVNEAQGLMGNLQNNPFFSGLTQGLQTTMQEPKNPTQERLQKKLQGRQQKKE